ncbi:hypothetical protein DFP72DRAFT_1079010 [Ephemerocybe angulata]|uniref:Uncharacterized protein n=1 Tax=Ephemerocybe angulata TaxID=980116 RepID=A0A8H6HBT5_9AGAR|nr:hypothetical protein DFP72DRAFT_1079010 [Tulosesus angulatus]
MIRRAVGGQAPVYTVPNPNSALWSATAVATAATIFGTLTYYLKETQNFKEKSK